MTSEYPGRLPTRQQPANRVRATDYGETASWARRMTLTGNFAALDRHVKKDPTEKARLSAGAFPSTHTDSTFHQPFRREARAAPGQCNDANSWYCQTAQRL